MKFQIVSPTKALILDATDQELSSLKDTLTYTNTAAAYDVKRHNNNHWLRSKDNEAWQKRLDFLKSKVKNTLVFEDEEGRAYIRPGSIPYLGDCEVENKIIYPEPKKVSWAKVPKFNPYYYQKESIQKLLAKKHGAVSITTGGGKSLIILHICRELGLKTVIMTPSATITDQLYKEFILYFGKGKVGKYGDGRKDTDKLFTLATGQALTRIEFSDKAWDDFSKTQVFVGDECFVPRTNIITNSGPKEIRTIYNKILRGEEISVLSFNEKLQQYEFKKVTNAWKREQKDTLVKITCSGISFTCTENHPLLTNNGWKIAASLEKKDILIGYRGPGTMSSINKIMNNDQEQVFLGSYLGDGSMSIHANGTRLSIIHGMAQEEYLRWKANIFNVRNIEKIEKNGYSQKAAIRFTTLLMSTSNPINVSRPKLEGIAEVLNRLDARGLAIWFMDDGSIAPKCARLHTESFPLEVQQQFVDFFKRKFNIIATIREDKGKDWNYYYLGFNLEYSQKLLNEIADYVHPSMAYKIRNRACGKYVWNNNFLDYGYTKVTNKEIIIPKNDPKYIRNSSDHDLYDLEVADNHNFVIGHSGGIVAHNCHANPAETMENVCHGILKNAPYRFFLSATQCRNDGQQKLLESINGEIVHALTTAQAIKEGFICPHEFKIVRIESSNPNMVSAEPLENKRIHLLRNKNVAQFAAKLANSSALSGKQTLILVEEVNQIAMIAPLLTVPYAIAHSEVNKARLEELGIEKADVAQAIEDFNSSKVKVLLGSSTISMGCNIYPTHNLINIQGGASEIKTKQGIGRAVRLHEQNPWADNCLLKEKAIIWDFDIYDVGVLDHQLKARIAWYKESETSIEFVNITK